MKILSKIKQFFKTTFDIIAEARMHTIRAEMERHGYKWDGKRYVAKN